MWTPIKSNLDFEKSKETSKGIVGSGCPHLKVTYQNNFLHIDTFHSCRYRDRHTQTR